MSLPDETLCLRADPVRLAQVLVNLLDNAAKHSGTKERIRLSAGARTAAACGSRWRTAGAA